MQVNPKKCLVNFVQDMREYVKKKTFVKQLFAKAFVVQPGLEPGLTEPKSGVLPLHHWTNFLIFSHVR